MVREATKYQNDNTYNAYLQRDGPPYDQVFPVPGWWCKVPDWRTTTGPEHIIHTVYEYTPGSLTGMPTIGDVLNKVRDRCARSVYLTDTFCMLSPYWNDEVQAVKSEK
jgi:hypothetical protein